jgi:DNA-binding GntR family transcriptional regulator
MPHHKAIKEAIWAGDVDAAESAMSVHHDQIWADLVAAVDEAA